eukprot:501839-Rhodomonas_salina.1
MGSSESGDQLEGELSGRRKRFVLAGAAASNGCANSRASSIRTCEFNAHVRVQSARAKFCMASHANHATCWQVRNGVAGLRE